VLDTLAGHAFSGLLFGCAMACWTLAEVIWGYYAVILNVAVPLPSWADLGYLSAIPLLSRLLSCTRRRRLPFSLGAPSLRFAHVLLNGVVIWQVPLAMITVRDGARGTLPWPRSEPHGEAQAVCSLEASFARLLDALGHDTPGFDVDRELGHAGILVNAGYPLDERSTALAEPHRPRRILAASPSRPRASAGDFGELVTRDCRRAARGPVVAGGPSWNMEAPHPRTRA